MNATKPKRKGTCQMRKHCTVLLAFLAVGIAYAPGALAAYTQHTVATIGPMTSQTVSTVPANRARTTVGIGEQVTCAIDPSSWSDTDCDTTPDPNQVVVDTMGTVTWSAGGAGSVSPSTGNSTTLTASKTPGSVTVQATVHDSGTKYVDTAVVKTKGFTVIAPNGMNVSLNSNLTLGSPGFNQIGAKALFDCTVLPVTVSFYNADFRENIPGESWIWPDGTLGTRSSAIVPWGVGYDNKTADTISSGLDCICRLDNGGGYQDFSVTVRVPEEYENQAGGWVSWLPNETHPRQYVGSNQTCRVGLVATQTAYSAYMGPWD